MAVITVFNNNTGLLERYYRAQSDPMPYTTGNTLTVREFMRNNEYGWTDLRAMQAWNILRGLYNLPIRIRAAFASIAEDGCLLDVQRYFGLGFLLQPTGSHPIAALHAAAVNSNAFSFVAPLAAQDTWIEVDNRFMPSETHLTRGLPYLFSGVRCNQVMTAQSALNRNGFPVAIDGIFGPETESAVRRFQRQCFLTEDGIVARLEWDAIFNTGCLPW